MIRADRLGKRYGSHWALRDCSFEVPRGAVTALVGPNGAGKSTLLNLAAGMTDPTTGAIEIDGAARIGFVAQDHPLYKRFSVADTLELGRRLNTGRWDHSLATSRVIARGIPLDRKIARLSGGEQAHVALALALAKRPDVLLLDEPVAALDPLARLEFLQVLMETAAEGDVTVVMSSHLLADLERVCDHVVVLTASRVRLAGPIEDVVASHRLLTGPRSEPGAVARLHSVVSESHTERQTSLVVRANGHVYDSRWQVGDLDLEEIVLAYLRSEPVH
jgi:ABC-2 type transport system ATP-binding protein